MFRGCGGAVGGRGIRMIPERELEIIILYCFTSAAHRRYVLI